jgi:hypothetical protein
MITTVVMAGLDPATQPASVSERKESHDAPTRVGWMAASRAAMTIWVDGES